MELLYSRILPIRMEPTQHTIRDTLIDQFSSSREVMIAVGYVSAASLEELDRLVDTYHIEKITLIIGMYYIEGILKKR